YTYVGCGCNFFSGREMLSQLCLTLLAISFLHEDFALATDPSAPQNVTITLVGSNMARISWEHPIRSKYIISGYRVSWTFNNKKQNHADLAFYNNSILVDLMSSKTLSTIVCTLIEKGASDISDGKEYLGDCSSEVTITTSALEEGRGACHAHSFNADNHHDWRVFIHCYGHCNLTNFHGSSACLSVLAPSIGRMVDLTIARLDFQ
ncbi:Oncosphere antigen A, partial [Taenia solium]